MQDSNISRKNILADKVFIDADVILDLLLKREKFYKAAAELFTLIEQKRIEGYTSPLIIANIYYIIARLKNKEIALEKTRLLRNLLRILSLDEKIIDIALLSPYRDFEDSIQYNCALTHNIKTIITRNTKDYPENEINILEPKNYILVYKKGN